MLRQAVHAAGNTGTPMPTMQQCTWSSEIASPGKRKRDLKMKWGRHRALLAQTAEPHPTYATGGRRVEREKRGEQMCSTL